LADLPAHTMDRTASMELWLEMIPLASISRGANTWTMARGPQTLTSYSLFASATSTSSSGRTNSTPALLTRTSSFPPVRFATVSLHCEMVCGTVTSSSSISTLLSSERSAALEGSRAVAKTWKPRSWKILAMAQPIPPVLQPMIRTVFFCTVAMVSLVEDGDEYE
jgi:hypothetical protein